MQNAAASLVMLFLCSCSFFLPHDPISTLPLEIRNRTDAPVEVRIWSAVHSQRSSHQWLAERNRDGNQLLIVRPGEATTVQVAFGEEAVEALIEQATVFCQAYTFSASDRGTRPVVEISKGTIAC